MLRSHLRPSQCAMSQKSSYLLFVKYCAGVTGYPVVLAPSVGDSVEGNYLGLYRVLGGVWGKHTAHFMTVFGYGAVRYKYLWHHLPVCPYFSDDLVAQKYKTFCYMGKLRLFL